MLSRLHHEVMKFIVLELSKFNIKMDVKYVPSLDMLNQYLTSLNYKKLFTLDEIINLTDEELQKMHKESYNLLMYNYSPFQRVDDKFNNINLEVFFNNPDVDIKSKFKEKAILKETGFYEVIQYIREKQLEDPNFEVPFRDAMYGKVSYECKFLTFSTRIMNDFQFIYLRHFNRLRNIEFEVNIGDGLEPIEMDFNISFLDIDSVGHIDYTKYGNLLQVSFKCNVYGLMLSNYVKYKKPLKEIDLKLKV